tara:strand:- start:126 stop:515 length:390 start_codon:yes stop_codon:yes gene_type:complete
MSLPQELFPIKQNLENVGMCVFAKTLGKQDKLGKGKYIGFKDKEGTLVKIGIYLKEGRKYICTWGIQNEEIETGGVTMSLWINKVKGICSNWEIGWSAAGTKCGGYPSNMKCIDGMELYEIIGELYKFM